MEDKGEEDETEKEPEAQEMDEGGNEDQDDGRMGMRSEMRAGGDDGVI